MNELNFFLKTILNSYFFKKHFVEIFRYNDNNNLHFIFKFNDSIQLLLKKESSYKR
ncbi:hypothetical protein CWI37_0199p0010 [Hamiltosporidium tvaerminnensis]|uniref:Uncharacterized protein n=1 Tax=Hamiltosporidium tvaerminnensis TaxID=1176355 RepID=A0A4Q9L9N4_9MICR|nr:hypothetical protein CWI37_0199p0010 [Hamiltosporidium tvaerminnensis]